MSSLDADNLRTMADKCKGFLRDDFLQAMEAAAAEIDRLQDVVRNCHARIRALKSELEK